MVKIDAEQNALIVGPPAALEQTTFTVGKMHYLSGETPTEPFEAKVKVRYKAAEVDARVTPLEGERVQVSLHTHREPLHPVRPPSFMVGEMATRCCAEELSSK